MNYLNNQKVVTKQMTQCSASNRMSTLRLAPYLLEFAMEKIVVDFDEEDIEAIAPPEEALRAKEALKARCKDAGLEVKEDVRTSSRS